MIDSYDNEQAGSDFPACSLFFMHPYPYLLLEETALQSGALHISSSDLEPELRLRLYTGDAVEARLDSIP